MSQLDYPIDQDKIIYDRYASSNVRRQLVKTQSLMDINKFEKLLVKLYETGDKMAYLLNKSFQNSNFAMAIMLSAQQESGKNSSGKIQRF